MSDHSSKYISYLLRLWQVDENGHRVWRASLEDPHTGERYGFANLGELVKYLVSQTGESGEEKQKGDMIS